MLNKELASELLPIYDKIDSLSSRILYAIATLGAHVEADSKINLYLEKITKCHSNFKQVLKTLDKTSDLYKNREVKDITNSLSKVKHDLINPIGGMKGYAEMILEKTNDQFIVSNINRIIEMISDLLVLVNHIKAKGSEINDLTISG